MCSARVVPEESVTEEKDVDWKVEKEWEFELDEADIVFFFWVGWEVDLFDGLGRGFEMIQVRSSAAWW